MTNYNENEEKKEEKTAVVYVEKEEDSHKRRALLLLILLLITGGILSTSTYAWFTANRNISVDPVSVKVAASSGITVSVDAINWKSSISNSDILSVGGSSTTYAAAVNQIPASSSDMSPVSTIGALSSGKMKMFAASISYAETASTDGNVKIGDQILTADQSVEAASTAATGGGGTAGNFVAFDMFIKSDYSTNIDLQFDGSVVADTNGKDTGIQDASRVALIKEGHGATTLGSTALQALVATDTTSTSSDILFWEPNYDVHTDTGLQNAIDNYKFKTDHGTLNTAGTNTLKVGTNSGYDYMDYYGLKATIAATDLVALASTSSTYFSDMTGEMDYRTKAGATTVSTDSNRITLEPGVTKYRVYMWVEGQDIDCENGASGGSIKYTISFSVPTTTTTTTSAAAGS